MEANAKQQSSTEKLPLQDRKEVAKQNDCAVKKRDQERAREMLLGLRLQLSEMGVE